MDLLRLAAVAVSPSAGPDTLDREIAVAGLTRVAMLNPDQCWDLAGTSVTREQVMAVLSAQGEVPWAVLRAPQGGWVLLDMEQRRNVDPGERLPYKWSAAGRRRVVKWVKTIRPDLRVLVYDVGPFGYPMMDPSPRLDTARHVSRLVMERWRPVLDAPAAERPDGISFDCYAKPEHHVGEYVRNVTCNLIDFARSIRPRGWPLVVPAVRGYFDGRVPMTPGQWSEQEQALHEAGADGYVLWDYFERAEDYPSARAALAAVSRPRVPARFDEASPAAAPGTTPPDQTGDAPGLDGAHSPSQESHMEGSETNRIGTNLAHVETFTPAPETDPLPEVRITAGTKTLVLDEQKLGKLEELLAK